MANVVNASATALSRLTKSSPPPLLLLPLPPPSSPFSKNSPSLLSKRPAYPKPATGISVVGPCCARRNNHIENPVGGTLRRCDEVEEEEQEQLEVVGVGGTETLLFSISPLLLLAAVPADDDPVRSLFGPFVEIVKSWNLPDWLVEWGHPVSMAIVLFAMGGYGSYLGFKIRSAETLEEKAEAKDLHPKLLGGMFFFFALGATGGILSLLTKDRPIFESAHGAIALFGLALLSVQTVLSTLFEGNPGLRNVHGILGSGIMVLLLINAALGLQLGLSF